MAMSDIILDKTKYRRTTLKNYDVTITKPSKPVGVHNLLSDAYIKTSTYAPYVIQGPCGEESVARIQDITGKYTFTDGQPVSYDELEARIAERGKVRATMTNTEKDYWVYLVPRELKDQPFILSDKKKLMANKSTINFRYNEIMYNAAFKAGYSNGDLSKLDKLFVGSISTDRQGQSIYRPDHGLGDYLVCDSLINGDPDLSTLRIVNGKLFERTYNMTPLRVVSLDTAFLLLAFYIQDLGDKDQVGYRRMQEECESNASVTIEAYRIVMGDKAGVLKLKLDRATRDLSTTYTILGKTYNYKTYSAVRAEQAQAGRDELDVIIYYVSEILNNYKQALFRATGTLSQEKEQLIRSTFETVYQDLRRKVDGQYTKPKITINEKQATMGIRHLPVGHTTATQIAVFADPSKSAFYFVAKVGQHKSDQMATTIVSDAKTAEQFSEAMRKMYTKLLNGYSDNSAAPQKPVAKPSKPVAKEVSDWFKYVQDSITRQLGVAYDGTITATPKGDNKIFFKVNNATVLVIENMNNEKLKVYNKNSNTSVALANRTEGYLQKLAQSCANFSKK